MQYTTVKGYTLDLSPIANITIFQYMSKSGLKAPGIPIYVDDNGKEMENPFHPIYHDALIIYDIQRHQVALNGILANCVKLQNKIQLQYQESFDILNKNNFLDKHETFEIWYLKNFILEDEDITEIIQNTLLTEQAVSSIFNSIRVTRDGMDISKTHLRNAVNTNIETDSLVIGGLQLVSPIDEIKAAQFSMINWQEWLRCDISISEKATAVALYRLDKIMETHTSDVLQIHQEREARKKNKG